MAGFDSRSFRIWNILEFPEQSVPEALNPPFGTFQQ